MLKAGSSVDSNAKKMLTIFNAELNVAADEGICAPKLWIVLAAIRRKLQASVRRVESLNSLITVQGDRSPNITLELLSARVGLKVALEVPAMKQCGNWRWSKIAPQVEQVFQTCCDHYEDGKDVAALDNRWSCPLPVPESLRPSSEEMKLLPQYRPGFNLSPSVLWATPYNLRWHQATKDYSALEHGLAINGMGPAVFVCAEKYRCVGQMIAATMKDGGAITIDIPMRFTSTIALFAEHYCEDVEDGITLAGHCYKQGFGKYQFLSAVAAQAVAPVSIDSFGTISKKRQ